MTSTIELPKQWRDAELRADTFNEADYTMDVCWTTGSTGRRMSWVDGPYDEELIVSGNAVRLGRLNAGAPLLNAHSDYSCNDVIGAVVPGSARIAGSEGLAKVQLSRAAGDADIVQKIRDRIIRNTSVGYVRHQIEKIEKEGAVPLWRVVDWEPYELSAVPMGFDAGAQFRSASTKDKDLFACIVRGGGSAASARARLRMRSRRLAALG